MDLAPNVPRQASHVRYLVHVLLGLKLQEIDACFPSPTAESHSRGPASSPAGVRRTDLSAPRAVAGGQVDLDGDDGDASRKTTNGSVARGSVWGDVRGVPSAGRKRPRGGSGSQAPGKGPSQRKPKGSVDRGRDGEESRGDQPASRGTLLAFLGCNDREIDLAKNLCRRLGQRRLYTQLVQGVTHVVISRQHTLEVASDGDTRRRYRLRDHRIDGYLEAVLLGLWVLDFSWVEACLDIPGPSRGARPRDRGGKRPELAPCRPYEMSSCVEHHEGCDAVRARTNRQLAPTKPTDGAEAELFRGHVFYLVPGSSRGSLRLEARLATLLELAGGRVSAVQSSALDLNQDDEDTEGDGRARKGRSGVTELVVAVADAADGQVSRQTAGMALERMAEIPAAAAAVGQSWVLRSIEANKRLPLAEHGVGARSPPATVAGAPSAAMPHQQPRREATGSIEEVLADVGRDARRAQEGERKPAPGGEGAREDRGAKGAGGGEGAGARRCLPGKLDIREKRSRSGGSSREVLVETLDRRTATHSASSDTRGEGEEVGSGRGTTGVMQEALEILEDFSRGGRKRARRGVKVAGYAKSVSKARGSPKGLEFTRVGEMKVSLRGRELGNLIGVFPRPLRVGDSAHPTAPDGHVSESSCSRELQPKDGSCLRIHPSLVTLRFG